MCVCLTFAFPSIHPRHLGCSHGFAVVNKAVMNVPGRCLFELVFFFPFDKYPDVQVFENKDGFWQFVCMFVCFLVCCHAIINRVYMLVKIIQEKKNIGLAEWRENKREQSL